MLFWGVLGGLRGLIAMDICRLSSFAWMACPASDTNNINNFIGFEEYDCILHVGPRHCLLDNIVPCSASS